MNKNLKHLIIPFTIILSALIIGGFYYFTQIRINKMSDKDVNIPVVPFVTVSTETERTIKEGSSKSINNRAPAIEQTKVLPTINTSMSNDNKAYLVAINKVSEASGILTEASKLYNEGQEYIVSEAKKDIGARNFESAFTKFNNAINEYNRGASIISSIDISSSDLPFKDNFNSLINLYKDLIGIKKSLITTNMNYLKLVQIGASTGSDLDQLEYLENKGSLLSKTVSKQFFDLYLQTTRDATAKFD